MARSSSGVRIRVLVVISVVVAASIAFSFTVPAFGDTGDCKHIRRVPATWDSVRCIVEVYPVGAYFRHWSDTLYRRRGDAVFYVHTAPTLDYQLVRVRAARKRNHVPVEWVEKCAEKPEAILLVPR